MGNHVGVEPGIGLADAVSALRDELVQAASRGGGSTLRFELGAIEMEFLIEARNDHGVDAGIKFWLVSAGGNASSGVTTSHRIKLTLDPRDAFGNSPLVSDEE